MLDYVIHAHSFTTSTCMPMGGECTSSGWMELYVTADATALSTAECLLQHFSRFGAPHQLRSDDGPHFIAAVIKAFLTLVGVGQCVTIAYSKEENAL